MAVENIHVDNALGMCGYPKWAFKRVVVCIRKSRKEVQRTRMRIAV